MTAERKIATTLDAPWLPPGSSAEVWVGHNCQVAEPVIVTRLLLVRRSPSAVLEFFCVPTPRGPNLPTRYLWADHADRTLPNGATDLMQDVFGRTDLTTRCVGFIRNVVPTPDADYPYPSPWAHVPVLLVTDAAPPIVKGDWLSASRGRAELSERHWWRIVEHHLAAADASDSDAGEPPLATAQGQWARLPGSAGQRALLSRRPS